MPTQRRHEALIPGEPNNVLPAAPVTRMACARSAASTAPAAAIETPLFRAPQPPHRTASSGRRPEWSARRWRDSRATTVAERRPVIGQVCRSPTPRPQQPAAAGRQRHRFNVLISRHVAMHQLHARPYTRPWHAPCTCIFAAEPPQTIRHILRSTSSGGRIAVTQPEFSIRKTSAHVPWEATQ